MDRDLQMLLIGLIGGGIIALLVNYFTQFTSSSVERKFSEWRNKQAQKRASRSKEKSRQRISKIEADLIRLKWFIDNPIRFNAFSYRALQRLILLVVFFIFFGVVILGSGFTETVRLGLILTFAILFFRTTGTDTEKESRDIFKHIYNFDSYETEMRKQIAELQKVVDGTKE